jgi:hypothetical protein
MERNIFTIQISQAKNDLHMAGWNLCLPDTLWQTNITMEKPCSMGNSTINGPFSMAILNYQRVYYVCNKLPLPSDT